MIDDYFIAKNFDDVFNRKQLYGFIPFYFTTMDDTKHGKHDNRHLCFRSGDMGFDDSNDDDGFKINPFFDLLTAGRSVSKDNKSNAQHNFDVLLEHVLQVETLANHCGAVVDNAAELEVTETHEIEMKFFEDKGRCDLQEVYGVPRKCIAHMDPFHCCQLAIQHCSEKGLGLTDKGNSRQVHHRQAMQTLYDLIICDEAMAQVICDEVLEKYSDELKYIIKAMRERMQRWLTNGRNAKHILEGYDLDVTGSNF